MRQPFSGTAERIFMKLLPNDRGENVVCIAVPKWGLAPPPPNAVPYAVQFWLTLGYHVGYPASDGRVYATVNRQQVCRLRTWKVQQA